MKCLVVDDDSMARKVLEQMVKKIPFLDLKGSFSSSMDCINYLGGNNIDILFLDIEMPEISGLEMLSNIPAEPLIIFTTGNENYSLQAFEHNVVDYLLKPIHYNRFLRAVLKAREFMNTAENEEKDFLFVKSTGMFIKLFFTEIFLVEALGDYIVIHTVNKKYTVHETMKSFEIKLPQEFVRVHRSFIVNSSQIKSIEDTTISIQDFTIPIGVSYKSDIYQKLGLS